MGFKENGANSYIIYAYRSDMDSNWTVDICWNELIDVERLLERHGINEIELRIISKRGANAEYSLILRKNYKQNIFERGWK